MVLVLLTEFGSHSHLGVGSSHLRHMKSAAWLHCKNCFSRGCNSRCTDLVLLGDPKPLDWTHWCDKCGAFVTFCVIVFLFNRWLQFFPQNLDSYVSSQVAAFGSQQDTITCSHAIVITVCRHDKATMPVLCVCWCLVGSSATLDSLFLILNMCMQVACFVFAAPNVELWGVMAQARSLLTAHEDFTTLMFTSPTEIQRPGLVFTFLKKYMPSEATVEEVKRMSLTADGKSAVFDVPSKLAQV